MERIKNSKGKSAAFIGISILLLIFFAACGKEENQNNQPVDPIINDISYDPATLTFFSGAAGTMNEAQFEEYVKGPVSKKYSHISLEFILTGKGTTINDLITSGQTPDLITNGPASIFAYNQLALTADVTPLANKHQFDLGRIDQSVLDFMRAYSDNKGIYAIPFMNGTPVLFYNKDIFDKFGLDYPRDRMTWEQIHDIGVRVTRTEDGVQYRAMEFLAHLYYNQLSANYIDPATQKSNFNSPEWKRLFETIDKFYKIPGSEFVSLVYSQHEEWFLKDRILAMFNSPFNNIFNGISSNEDAKNTFNWDLVTMPVFADKPNLGAAPIPNYVMITSTSKNQDAGFLVVETILSDEVQGMLSRNGIIPVLKSQSIKDEFLKDVEFSKGKNLAAIFALDRAPVRVPSEYDGAVQGILKNIQNDLHSGKKDINTALREAEEAANQVIEAEKAKRK